MAQAVLTGEARPEATTRVLVVEDHPIMLEAIATRLGECADIEVVGTATDGRNAVAAYEGFARRGESPLVLCDISLPRLDGIGVLRAVRRTQPEAVVVLFTAHEDRSSLLSALDAGAAGFVVKTASARALVDAVRAAAQGREAFDPTTAAMVASERRRPENVGTSGFAPLTMRELEVLQALGRGLSTKEIADELLMGTETVRTHLRQVFRKLGVNDRSAAVATALRSKMIR